MGAVETDLAERLRGLGFDVAALQLSEFQRGGGSAKSLALAAERYEAGCGFCLEG